ncbi:hypothetical protein GCK72_000693 [Caenorhabditis remanei]|uniref:Uncharacterized protein n=1 Tax=Caenorhabditis remanei TaxID=31234 RepID=A0A6A5HL18_CAERE|nr:hypothetical protein GCK72_000693 [Caenorhabditis remanei]KAF1768880.1 hypothetical protein GCK72_000693 [Caenorhabditis remanei]
MSPPAHLLSVNHLHHQTSDNEKFTIRRRRSLTHLTNTPNNPTDFIKRGGNQRKRYNHHNKSHNYQQQSVSDRWRREGGRRGDADTLARRRIIR